MASILFKSVGIWLVVVVIAIVNGIFREKILVPTIGTSLSLPLSGILLSIFVFLITLWLIPFIGHNDGYVYILIGFFWVILTLSFEFLFGHYVIGKSWQDIMQVFNIKSGDLFSVVLLVSFISPWIAAKLRDLF